MPNRVIGLFLVLCAMVHLSDLVQVNYNSPIDFRNIYLGTKLWASQQNPYIDSVLKQEWFSICEFEGLSSNQPPGLPQNFLVYPPHALLLYMPISFFPWKVAVWINLFICLISLFIWVVLLNRLIGNSFNLKLNWQTILVVLAFKGTIPALMVGQPSFLANVLGLAGVYFLLVKKQQPWAIVFFILASFKPTTLLPYMLICVYYKNWRVLVYTLLGICGLVMMSVLIYPQPLQLFQSALANMVALQQLIYQLSNFYYLSAGTELGLILEYALPQLDIVRTVLYIMIALGLFSFLYRNQSLHRAYLLSLVMCFVLLTTHHLFYDVLFLLPLVIVARNYSPKIQQLLASVSVPFFIPINGILDRMQLPDFFDFLYLTTPTSLFIILIILLLNPIHRYSQLP